MKKIICALIILFVSGQAGHAVFHDFGLDQGDKNLSYSLMPQLNYSRNSGAVSYDYSLERGRSLEISYITYGNWNLIPGSNSADIRVLGKQRLYDFGSLSLTGMIGVGALYASSLGAIFSPNLGMILGVNILPGIKFALPVVASIYSDPGVMLDYSAGLSVSPPLFSGKSILAGFKGTLMAVADPKQMVFGNTLYYYGGVRAEL